MGIRAIVCCVVAAGLIMVGLGLAGILAAWGFDWVTITSEAPAIQATTAPTSSPNAEPNLSLTPFDTNTDGIAFTTDERYPPNSVWTVFDVPAALNVRAGPGTNHQIVGTAELDSTVTLTGQVSESSTSGTWVQAQTPTITGWVFAGYLTPVPPNPQ